VWQNLEYLLRLRIAIWITQTERHLKLLCIPRGAIQVIGGVREAGSVVAVDASPIGKCVVRRADLEVACIAVCTCFWIDDHFTVSGDI
jgi:hypothetical protein